MPTDRTNLLLTTMEIPTQIGISRIVLTTIANICLGGQELVAIVTTLVDPTDSQHPTTATKSGTTLHQNHRRTSLNANHRPILNQGRYRRPHSHMTVGTTETMAETKTPNRTGANQMMIVRPMIAGEQAEETTRDHLFVVDHPKENQSLPTIKA